MSMASSKSSEANEGEVAGDRRRWLSGRSPKVSMGRAAVRSRQTSRDALLRRPDSPLLRVYASRGDRGTGWRGRPGAEGKEGEEEVVVVVVVGLRGCSDCAAALTRAEGA